MARLPLRLVSAIGVLLIAAGCTGTAGSLPSATASVAPSVAPSAAASVAPSVAPSIATATPAASPSGAAPTSAPASSAPSASGAPSISSSDWGEFWDALPPGFPLYPGAQPTVTGGDPASAILDVPADAPTASTWFQNALKAAGFSIEGANGPREDGSYEIVATKGGSDCRTEITLAPLGTTTTATIYLAAACPFN